MVTMVRTRREKLRTVVVATVGMVDPHIVQLVKVRPLLPVAATDSNLQENKDVFHIGIRLSGHQRT